MNKQKENVQSIGFTVDDFLTDEYRTIEELKVFAESCIEVFGKEKLIRFRISKNTLLIDVYKS